MSSANQRLLVSAIVIGSKRPRFPLWGLAFVLGALMFAGIPNARAAFVTTNEAGVDAVYSQSSFGSTPVDIFFSPTVSLSNGSLLNINDSAGLDTLFSFNDATATNVVSIYFVDTVNWCGSFNTSIVGCANLGGNDIVVESAAAFGTFGTELIAHELGHSLGLDHVTGDNLMNAVLNGSTTLTSLQVADLLGSSLIQMNGSGRFVDVRPVLVTPLPSAGILFVSAILVLFGVNYRKKLHA